MRDPEAITIGEIANDVISDFEVKGKVDIVANRGTAPDIVTALEARETDVRRI